MTQAEAIRVLREQLQEALEIALNALHRGETDKCEAHIEAALAATEQIEDEK